MTQIRCMLCLLLTIALILLITYVYSDLPLKTDVLISEKYDGWAGAIRIWIYEGWSPGISGAAGWLNKCASSFENAHEGVYVQINAVDAASIMGLCENGVIPPDMIIFPPGILKNPSHLIPLEANPVIRPELFESGMYNGFVYAHPILIGGYAWAFNTEMLERIPNSWSNLSNSLSIPSDNAHYSYSTALTALCSHRFLPEADASFPESTIHRVDLGLPLEETPSEPSTTPVPSTVEFEYCALPEDISSGDSALSDFTSGKTSAIPVSLKDIRYLKNLSGRGKGPDWTIQYSGDMSFTDHILYAAVTDNNNSNPEKEALCMNFLDHILSDESQEATGSIGACSVTDVYSGYHGSDPFAVIEDALRRLPVCAESAFYSVRNEHLNLIVRDFLSSRGFSSDLYRRIMRLCS